MKRLLVILALVTLAAPAALAQKVIGEAAKELADQIAAAAGKQQKHKIAVIPFRELDGRSTILGTFLAEELVTDLFAAGTMDIVERSMLDKVMSELKLSQSGAIDPESAKHVGKIVGVEAIVTGSITDLQSYVGVNCRLIDTETGRIFGAAQTKIVKDADLQKILAAAAPVAAASSSPVPAPQPTMPAAKPPQKTVDGIGVELRGCKVTGGNLSCGVVVTNQSEEDRHVYLSIRGDHAAVLIDDQSTEYRSFGGSLGLESSESAYDLQNTLVPGIPLKASVRFANVPASVTGIRLLRLQMYSGRNNINVDFRDVAVQR